jgi:hypothetical protein
MKTYKAVQLHTGDWSVQMFVDGVLSCIVVSCLQTEGEALFAVYTLAREEVPPKGDTTESG